MGTCDDYREDFSDFYDNTLDTPTKAKVAAHLATCPPCASEYRSFVRTLEVIRAIPPDEPTIDLWAEFAPMMAEFEAEQKFNVFQKLARWGARFVGRASEGAIIFTRGLAERTTRRLSKYLIHDPFSSK
jgi:anti-sigma factor RsiW